MDKKIDKNLNKLSIPNDSYSIGSIEDEALCMIFDGLTWCIFIVRKDIVRNPNILQAKMMPVMLL